jgi:TonB family protein
MTWKSAAAATLALTLLNRASRAQTVQGALVGEKSHHPIGNAHVTLVDDSDHVAAATTTDSSSGAFYLTALRSGQYRVRVVVGHGGVTNSPLFQLDSDQTVERTIVAPDWPDAYLRAFLPDDVTTPARLELHQAPRYPDAARAHERAGAAVLRFVVGADGKVDPSTLAVVSADDPLFAQSVADFAVSARFAPATTSGVPVPQVYELSVDFGFDGDPVRITDKKGIIVRALARRRSR